MAKSSGLVDSVGGEDTLERVVELHVLFESFVHEAGHALLLGRLVDSQLEMALVSGGSIVLGRLCGRSRRSF